VPDILAKLAVPVADTPVLALCPGAEYGPAKRWPVRHFAELASLKLNEGWRVWLLGSSRDAPFAQAINDAVHGNCVDLSGRTSLDQAVDLLSATTQVVSNDSGLMHIAAAVGRPLVAVYGSSNPNFTPPLSPNARSVSLEPSCLCFKRTCQYGHTECLENLLPERVTDALAEIGQV
jgi:heptosyltransferase-2